MPGPDHSRRLFELFARPPLGQERVDHPEYAARLAEGLRADMAAELANPIWINGRRIQNMFEAMVVAFDCYTLIKTEDAGILHPLEGYSLPDFRIVLKDGEKILVEVKNFWCADPWAQRFEMRAADLEKKLRYADTMGVPLKIAIRWARWGIWTLIDPAHFGTDGAVRHIGMLEALPRNETLCIGDQTIATKALLTIRFETDRNKDRKIADDGQAEFTVSGVQVQCDGVHTAEAKSTKSFPMEGAFALVTDCRAPAARFIRQA